MMNPFSVSRFPKIESNASAAEEEEMKEVVPEFEWGIKRRIGGRRKDVQFYQSFTYNAVHYNLFDCVYLYNEDESEPYVGKLIKIWENRDQSKKVKVQWFFRPREIRQYLTLDVALHNELFLACGEGFGAASVIPLEAVAGKCNVSCISKDIRNPQPSVVELVMADFVFYRFFDVGRCKILDKIDDNMAAIDGMIDGFNHMEIDPPIRPISDGRFNHMEIDRPISPISDGPVEAECSSISDGPAEAEIH